ncbi:MAG: branched-chain amino acid transporter permease [Ramlibacter sp.]|nr:branched-chain amino acid transporter permease [Ramlibacter sp.]
MQLLLSGVISGVAIGLLYGLLGFAIVVLYKCTSVANFAQGNLGAVATFLVFQLLVLARFGLVLALALGLVISALVGAACYFFAIRPKPEAGHLNVTMRTLGLYLLLLAIMNVAWGKYQPYTFPAVFSSEAALTIADVNISWLTVGTLLIALAMAAAFETFFRRTDLGLMFLAVAENPAVASLLGVNTRKVTVLAWAISSVVAYVIAVLVVPVTLLSSTMMDLYLLLAFTSAIIGGLNNIYGPFLGGLLVGVVYNVAAIQWSRDAAVACVFVLLLAVMMFRPSGILSSARTERL